MLRVFLIAASLVLVTVGCQTAKKKGDIAKKPTDQVTLTETAKATKTTGSTSKLEIAKIAIAAEIANREPVNPGKEFPSDIGRLFCYTKVTGASNETKIKHVWYYKNGKMAEIPLAIRGMTWRTKSSKNIEAHQTGNWRVDVTNNNGKLLDSINFTVK